MSLTLWHRQFRNPIFLVLWTCYSEVQLVTSAAVSLFGGATRCMNICVKWQQTYLIITTSPVRKKNILNGEMFHCMLRMHQLKSSLKVAVNVSGGEQTFPQIMADFSLFVH